MSVSFYLDVHVPRAVATSLRLRGVDILTAQEDGAGRASDRELLLRANSLGRVLVTQDEDLLREGADLLRRGDSFAGIVYGHQMLVDIGQLVEDLTLIAQASKPADWAGTICYLPL